MLPSHLQCLSHGDAHEDAQSGLSPVRDAGPSWSQVVGGGGVGVVVLREPGLSVTQLPVPLGWGDPGGSPRCQLYKGPQHAGKDQAPGMPLTNEDVVLILALPILTHFVFAHFLCKRQQASAQICGAAGPALAWGLPLSRALQTLRQHKRGSALASREQEPP